MSRTYNVIDADGHILEPFSLWNDYIDPRLSATARRGWSRTRTARSACCSRRSCSAAGRASAASAASAPARARSPPSAWTTRTAARAASIRTRASPTWISTASTPPSSIRASACSPAPISDPEFAAAMCRAYNRWLADYCKPYPDRLFGIAMLPMQSIEAAIEEMRFARKELGFRGGFLRPNPYNDRKLHDPDYEPFWSAAEELDFCDRPARGRQQRHADGRRRPLRRPRRAAHHLAHHGDDAGRDEHDLGRRVRAPSQAARRLPRIGRRLDRALARPHGPPLRRQGLQRLRPEDAAERAVPAQLLDLLRAGRGLDRRAGRLYRPAQDPVGDRLPAPRRLLPRRARDDRGAA